MEWTVNLAFLLVGYLLRLLAEPKCKCRKKKTKVIQMPTLNPMKAIKQYKETKQEEKDRKDLQIMLENIENYDGTSNGQKSFE